MAEPLWRPDADRIAKTRITDFTRRLETRVGRPLRDFAALHRSSTNEPDAFWTEMWDFAGLVGDRGSRVVTDFDRMPGARFFPDARLNFSENLLRRRDDAAAIVALTETGADRVLSFGQLRGEVCRAARALAASGVRPGDRVCGIVANVPEAIIAALGAAAIGAVWSSCSPDFGVQGILDRFSQITPIVLLSVDGYDYGGKRHECLGKLAEVAAQLGSVERVVVIPGPGREGTTAGPAPPQAVAWEDWLAPHAATDLVWERFPFSHPLYILYSSGTTGVPKCIVHTAGGVLLQHLKEHQLHGDVRPGDRMFYFTTCGWVMWNWLVSGLASRATLLLYDGSPLIQQGRILWKFAAEERVTHFGTSAKFIDAQKKIAQVPRKDFDLSALRVMFSTGSPLAPESFDYVYQCIKEDLCLSSISGGTDIASCFALGAPTLPVWRGELQCRGLGMDVDVFDEEGVPVVRATGELVCKSPFPAMPLGFWNDIDGAQYRATYFERFPGVWRQGDWAELTEHGGVIILGRSDATLNPGGVRIGTSEIYREVERLPEIVESLVIGQDWPPGEAADVRVVLFVTLREGLALDAALTERIRRTIRANTTPRHVPAKVVQVTDLPRTKNGKIVELAVRDVVHGRDVRNLEALANPESLAQYRDLEVLKS
jgi:acetoacetyl-CoA synthetase